MIASPIRLDPNSDEAIREQVYQLERGVRPMALLGGVPSEKAAMEEAYGRLQALSGPTVIPFVIDVGTGWAQCGFASAQWAIELFRWAHSIRPKSYNHIAMVTGLLLGYSPHAIGQYLDRSVG